MLDLSAVLAADYNASPPGISSFFGFRSPVWRGRGVLLSRRGSAALLLLLCSCASLPRRLSFSGYSSICLLLSSFVLSIGHSKLRYSYLLSGV